MIVTNYQFCGNAGYDHQCDYSGNDQDGSDQIRHLALQNKIANLVTNDGEYLISFNRSIKGSQVLAPERYCITSVNPTRTLIHRQKKSTRKNWK